jgi:dTDP-4-amino-4,6-dideoxygalactose transaminase
MQRIPVVDLKAQYSAIKDEIDSAISGIIRDTSFILGEPVEAFEAAFAEYCGASRAVGCGNGTDALYLALRALGVGPGHEVIIPANTFIATSEAVSLTGARPVFADVQEDTSLVEPAGIADAITQRSVAIIPVHLYGQSADMDEILDIARRHGLKVVEDAAQAHGARYKGRRVGALGDAGCFSFFPGKNLGAYGDAGAIVASDDELADRLAMLRNHGRRKKYTHDFEGVNSRLDALQAAILSVKLKHLDEWNEQRRRVADRYASQLTGVPGLRLPVSAPDREPVWHLYVVHSEGRDVIREALKAEGVASGVHYPIPLHLQPAYAHLGHARGSFPAAEKLANTALSLPIYAELADEQVDLIADIIRKAAD